VCYFFRNVCMFACLCFKWKSVCALLRVFLCVFSLQEECASFFVFLCVFSLPEECASFTGMSVPACACFCVFSSRRVCALFVLFFLGMSVSDCACFCVFCPSSCHAEFTLCAVRWLRPDRMTVILVGKGLKNDACLEVSGDYALCGNRRDTGAVLASSHKGLRGASASNILTCV
jgi:hypothetical protein